MKTEPGKSKRLGQRVSVLVISGLIIVLGQPQKTLAQWTTGTNINNTNTGNVGVGTSSPAAKLHVAGANGPSDNTAAPAPDALQATGGVGGNGYWWGSAGGLGGAINFIGGTGGTPVAGSQLALGGKGGSISLTGGTGGPNVFNVGGGKGGDVLINGGPGVANSDGNILLGNLRGYVGIGMSSPAFRLDVNGEINATGLRINGAPIATGGSTQWTTSGSSIYYMSNVGIGTNSPNQRLSVAGTGAFYNSTPIAPSGVRGLFMGNFSGGSSIWSYNYVTGAGDSLSISAQDINFGTYVSGNGVSRLHISNAGNVGIGNTSPTEKLDIAGNIRVTGTGNITAVGTITGGTINAKYQDVAEWVESSQSLPAGTVVVLDHTKSNQVVASTQAYDTRVAGVISAQPGITLGESGETKVLVATTGRVKIKVDATRAPIQVGDLLVTGDREGFAMKSLPVDIGGVQLHRPGTLVGKALEPLAKGTGEILVLLSLQ